MFATPAVTVNPGQTLSGIAAAHGDSLPAIETANPQISDPGVIYPGETVNLPGDPPSQPPAQTPSSVQVSTPSGFQACVIQHESSGNYQVTNSSGHYGAYQMTQNLWVLGGGSPGDFGHATPAEQNAVFSDIMANDINGGASNWAPYDHC
jgi:hypothetical protein